MDCHAAVFQNSTACFMARIRDFYGNLVTAANIDQAAYSVFLLDQNDSTVRTPITGHYNVPLNPDDILFSPLQTNFGWNLDNIGFNFMYQLNVSDNTAFAQAGRHYLVEFTLKHATTPYMIRYRVFSI